MKNIVRLLYIAVLLVTVASCQEDYVPGKTATEALAGEWYVKTYSADLSATYVGYQRIATYNTASNSPDSIWVDDYENIFGNLRLKVPGNTTALTFGSPDVEASAIDGSLYSIDEGKIILKGTVTPGGLQDDSIYFKITDYSDTTTYVLAGYRHTGWEADNH
ncbi:lipid-binding protein [Prolixibacter denitrificans]|uniref:Lipid-binding putative hydrolase n=1 Tax=Prolixibacter denitrificans TaxID=1541063 RepID=A0A2P8CBP0_9BACT|nr:lipid-binding protein [Prolixibacter denitrificans]PSK82386.1 lipid-binding putative hydrolase [Prolixibacter denitrificans]GET22868.1 hypothetical protein JCM18694_31140 [Prolixibacter denitrificans]